MQEELEEPPLLRENGSNRQSWEMVGTKTRRGRSTGDFKQRLHTCASRCGSICAAQCASSAAIAPDEVAAASWPEESRRSISCAEQEEGWQE